MKKYLLTLLFYVLVACLLTWFFLHLHIRDIQTNGVVYEHAIIASRNGHRYYITVVKTDNGGIVEKTGLKYYTIPIGSRISYTERRLVWE